MVYLVDDDAEDLELVQQALAQYSYKGPVVSLNNGKMLIDRLSATDNGGLPDVIILDLNMPLLDGFQTLKAIRTNPSSYQKTAVIVLTSSSRKEDELRCFELGCNYFLNKPHKVSDYQTLATIVKRFASV